MRSRRRNARGGLSVLQDRRGGDPRRRSCTPPSAPSRSATSTRRRRRTCWSCRRTTTPTPPSSPPATPSPRPSSSPPAAAVATAEGYDDYRLVFNTGAGAGQTVFHTHLHLLGGAPDDLAARMNRRARSRSRSRPARRSSCRRSRPLRPGRRRRRVAPAPPASCSTRRTRPRSRPAAGRIKPGKQLPLRDGEHRMTCRCRRVHAVGADRQRHRRLPLLPARPRARRGRLADRQQRAARQPRRRAPRDPVPGHPGQVAEAEQKDAQTDDEGWTCFGGTGLAGEFANVDDATWLAAWAPGGDETKVRDGYGVRLEAGHPDRHAGPLQPAEGRGARRLQRPSCAGCRRAAT